jgi:PAS domain S-box-containing protein
MASRHAPLVYASMEIKYEITQFHLWFEELIQGDPNIDREAVWRHLQEARRYANMMLEGGANLEGAVPRLDEPLLRSAIRSTLSRMAALEQVAERRLERSRLNTAGSSADQEFDKIFTKVLDAADRVETILKETIAGELLSYRVECLVVGGLVVLFGLTVAFAFFRDITRRRRTEASLRRTNRALQALSECSQALVRATDEGTLLNEVCRIIVEVGGYRLVWVGYAEQDALKSVRPVAQKGFEDGYLDTIDLTWADTTRGRGPTGIAIRTGGPCAARNIPTDPTYAPWQQEARVRGYVSSIALPLRDTAGETFGALSIYAAVREAFDTAEERLLSDLADDLAYGICALRTRAEGERAERAFQESENKYRRLVENLGVEYFFYAHDPDGVFSYVSPSITRILGYSQEEFLGHYLEFITDNHLNEEVVRRTELTLQGHQQPPYEVEAYHKDGGHRWLEVAESPVFDADAKVTSVEGLARDITEHKRAREELQRHRDRLEQRVTERTAALEANRQRLEQRNTELAASNQELKSFSYSVSHDLRAPLRAIDGFSQALEEDYGDRLDDTGRDFLRRVRAAAQRMGELIDDLLTLSRVVRRDMHREAVDLGALVRGVAAQLQAGEPAQRKQLVIQDGLEARGDAPLLRIALENLLDNAWKYTGGKDPARIEFGATQADGERVYYVRDNGVGFDMRYADKLFGAFQRLHNTGEFEGTGIGLAIVQRIVQRHGGRIWAEAQVGRGATFYFTLAEKVADNEAHQILRGA